MRPINFKKLIKWIFEEYKQNQSIFGIPDVKFFRKKNKNRLKIFGETYDTPIGPAAGPHTQLSQNIISSYLSGARFFELKTVQKLDNLHLEKPCIDVEDEGYNTEWSTELTILQAYDEYVKAWLLLHLLQKLFKLSLFERNAFIFNMSVGYDLKGIKSSKLNNFIEGMKDATNLDIFDEYKSILKKEIRNFNIIKKENSINKLDSYIENISQFISKSITLSTMHGCPPEEIEAICKYLIKEKELHTYLKLNPTLLGYKTVRSILDKTGFNYIQLKKESFSKDLKYYNAVDMIKNLIKFAKRHNKKFGVKLSNTLPVVNNQSRLHGNEMYLSGRALFPLTINLASRIASEFNGNIDISYSGGASFFNILQIFETGIRPITLVTDLLKPGGYLRFHQLANELETYLQKAKTEKINLDKLKILADNSLTNFTYFKSRRYSTNLKIDKELPLLDCFIAPCIENCPVKQDIPEYIRLINKKQYLNAFELIISKNPLPNITGYICDHNCMLKCTRNDYETPILIRDLERIATEKGYKLFIEKSHNDIIKNNVKVAIIGAGPSGLSAGYFLAKAGFDVTIYDKRDRPGGTVQYVIPNFRLPQRAIENNVYLIKKMGVKFLLGMEENFSINTLKNEGYKYIYLAIGAGKSTPLKLNGENNNVHKAIEFLENFNIDKNKINLGKRIAVIGGGNSAMDSARAAMRVKGVEKVYIIYRRTEEFMPASREEFENALSDGVGFRELLYPVAFYNNILRCQKMKLGNFGQNGRRTPIPIKDEFEEIQIDSVISAIGEYIDTDILKKNGIKLIGKQIEVNMDTLETNIENVFIGGDALQGPSTVVKSIADGKKVAETIIEKHVIDFKKPQEININKTQQLRDILEIKGRIIPQNKKLTTDKSIEQESSRCLQCDFVCAKCVDVCPNRANVAIKTNDNFKDIYQILHIDGMCNKCGNCETFCPYDGKPYNDKLTLYWLKKDFLNSENNGFILENDTQTPVFKVRLNSNTFTIKYNKYGEVLSKYPEYKFEETIEINKIIKFIWLLYKNYKYLII